MLSLFDHFCLYKVSHSLLPSPRRLYVLATKSSELLDKSNIDISKIDQDLGTVEISSGEESKESEESETDLGKRKSQRLSSKKPTQAAAKKTRSTAKDVEI